MQSTAPYARLCKVFSEQRAVAHLIATNLGLNPPGDFPPEIVQFGFPYRIVLVALPLCAIKFYISGFMGKTLFIINRCWIFFSALVIITYFKLANRLKVFGVENVPKKGGVLLVSNHVSMFETIIIPSAILSRMPGGKVFAPVKVELFKIPVLKTIIASWGSFPVKRGSAHISVMKKITELMKKEKVMVFPEGTRSRTGELGKGNRMLGRFILDAKPVVVPVRIFGAEKILGTNQERPKPFHKVTVKFGTPLSLERFYTAESNTKEISREIIDAVMDAISQLKM